MSIVTPLAISLVSGIPILAFGFYYNWSAFFMCFLMAVPGFIAFIIDVNSKELYRQRFFEVIDNERIY